MPSIQELSIGTKLKMLVYGRSKVGKTAGAGTFPRPNIIDFDKGVGTMLSPWWRSVYGDNSHIMYEQFPERGAMQKGVHVTANAFDDACRYFDACMKSTGAKWTSTSNGKVYDMHPDMFDTWVLDSGTSLAEAATRKGIIVLGSGTGKSLSQTHKNALASGLVTLKQQDFGAERSMTEQFVAMLLDTDKNVIVLAHEKTNFNDDGSAVIDIVPLFTGQSTERIPLKFDEVYNLRAIKEGINVTRKLTTQADGIRLVGTRALNIPNGTAWDYKAIQAAVAVTLAANKLTTKVS